MLLPRSASEGLAATVGFCVLRARAGEGEAAGLKVLVTVPLPTPPAALSLSPLLPRRVGAGSGWARVSGDPPESARRLVTLLAFRSCPAAPLSPPTDPFLWGWACSPPEDVPGPGVVGLAAETEEEEGEAPARVVPLEPGPGVWQRRAW